jgi:transposase-like protein
MPKSGPHRSYSNDFRQAAVQRMESTNITQLAQELGLHRRLLYQWRRQLAGLPRTGTGTRTGAPTAARPDSPVEQELRQQLADVKQLLANKVLEADFFAAAWQRIAAQRLSKTGSGAPPSTTRSGRR